MSLVERYDLDSGCAMCRLALQQHIDTPAQQSDREEALALLAQWKPLPLNAKSNGHAVFGKKDRRTRKH